MKCNILTFIVCVILLLFSNITVSSSTNTNNTCLYDSVRISLLTCSPHNEVYSLYGHTALRYENDADGQDFVVNYGVFDFGQKFFILKFAFGLTDYTMGVVPFYYFAREYEACGSSITQQEINLTAAEKEAVAKALQLNYQPENRIYRYNCFYKNCSTMARDIVTDNIDGEVIYPETNEEMSYRDLTHMCNDNFPWAKLGNDLVLGLGADMNIGVKERQFLPAVLMDNFSKAVIKTKDGTRPLVKKTTVVLQAGTQMQEEDFPLTPMMCFGIVFAICIAVCVTELIRKKMTLWFDTLLMLATGFGGLLVFTMYFSQHPTTSTNLMIFMLNPLPLFFIRSIYRAEKKGAQCTWWKIWMTLGLLSLISGLLIQDFDNSMVLMSVAISLRAAMHLRNEKVMKLKK